MNVLRNRILVLHSDEQTLIDLQQVLEDGGFDTTTTWDPVEAAHQLRSRQFDLLLVGDHPPDVAASEILRELQSSRASVSCVILQPEKNVFDSEYFYSLGAGGVIAKWTPDSVCHWVQQRFLKKKIAVAAG
jgi:DNA-binding response OmpR family regulator